MTTRRIASGDSTASGPLLVILAAALWGTTGTAQGLAPVNASSVSVGAVRLVIGGLALVVLARSALRQDWTGALRHPSTYVAAAGMAAYQPLFFGGVARTGVGIGTAVAIGSAPVLTGLASSLLGRERLTARWMGATVLAVGGVVVLTLASSSDPTLDSLGALMTLGAGAAYATYAVAARKLAGLVEVRAAAAGIFGLAALVMLPVALASDLDWVAGVRGASVALWLGIAATAVAYALFSAGIRAVTASRAATLSLTEPVTALALAVILLDERPSIGAWAGAALVVIGLTALASTSGDRRSPRSESR